MMDNRDPRKREADALARRFLAELDQCKSERERIDKVWELVAGIVKSARRAAERQVSA